MQPPSLHHHQLHHTSTSHCLSAACTRRRRAAPRRRDLLQQRLVLCRSGMGQPSAQDALEQLALLRRQLEGAVAQEDYTRAKQLKEQADALKQQLSPVQQYVQHQLEQLQGGSTADKAAAIQGLGEVGGEEALPHLAACLGEPELCDAAMAAMWAVFGRHPDGEVQLLMQQGVSFMQLNQLQLALEAFDAAARLAPSFAEAHNKRATVLYLLKDFKASVDTCDLVLDLNPYHFAAAEGQALACLGMQDMPGALRAFERALAIHPGLQHVEHFIAQLRANQQRPEDGSEGVE